MFWNSGKFFELAANISMPLLDGGVLRHRQRAAEESYKQAAAQYKETVITAFQNVADTLHAIHADAEAL
ncbi:Outer membrane efflux protein [compost metagenome]